MSRSRSRSRSLFGSSYPSSSPSHQPVSDKPSLQPETETIHPDPLPSFLTPPSASETADQLSDNETSSAFSSAAERSLRHEPNDRFRHANRLEIDLYQSFTHLESNDLSIQLYNTHVLKRRLCTGRYIDRDDARTQLRSKTRWQLRSEWVPYSRWTAWPLDLEDVPLEYEDWVSKGSWVSEDSRKLPNMDKTTLRAELEAILGAECLKWAQMCLRFSRGRKPDHHMTHDRIVSQSSENIVCMPSTEHRSSTRRASKGQQIDKPEPNVDSCSLNKSIYAPTIVLDEDEADSLLSSETQKILHNLDCLLSALHVSRLNGYPNAGNCRRNALHEPKEIPPNTIYSSSEKDLWQDTSYILPIRRKPHPRDWSEVLGVALQVGWDTDVVERVLKRCKKLFNETIKFQRTTQSDANQEETSKASGTRQSFNKSQPDERHDRHVVDEITGARQFGWACPETNCTKEQQIYYNRDEWLQHIQDTHGYKYSGVETIVPLNMPKPSVDEFPCPDPDCERHDWPYPKRWRLQAHLKRKHGRRMVSRASTPISNPQLSDADDKDENDELLNGVHVDGFLQPIPIPKNWRTYTKSTSSSSVASSRPQKRARRAIDHD